MSSCPLVPTSLYSSGYTTSASKNLHPFPGPVTKRPALNWEVNKAVEEPGEAELAGPGLQDPCFPGDPFSVEENFVSPLNPLLTPSFLMALCSFWQRRGSRLQRSGFMKTNASPPAGCTLIVPSAGEQQDSGAAVRLSSSVRSKALWQFLSTYV